MDIFSNISLILDAKTLALILGSTITGVLIGALPGLSSGMAIALLLPFTIYLEPSHAIAAMAALYCGGTFGGSITAILINAPGAPPAAATAFDGFPMAQKGQAGKALGMAAVSSVVGGVISLMVLITFAPTLARIAYKFGPPEYFALAIFGLSMLASISSKSPVKNLIGGLIGLFVATIGVHLTTGISRFTFGVDELFEGISFVPVLIGLFAMSEILVQASKSELLLERIKFSAIKLPSIREFKSCGKSILRSSGIGTFIGILPAEGGTVSAMIGYNEARRWSKNKENFGKGEIEGVAAPESANNAATGGAMIPTLALGIPGSATTAVILGGFQIHGLRAGPYLFEQQPDLLYTIFYGMLLANFIFLIFGLMGAKIFSRISLIPRGYLWPSVFVFCLVGSYGLSQSMVDVYIMLISGVLGFFLRRYGFSPAPIIMGIVLGELVENSLAQSIIIFDQNIFMFFTRPICLLFFGLTFLSLFYRPIKNLIMKGKKDE